MEKKPYEVHDEHDRYFNVKGYEVGGGEVGDDGRPPLDYEKVVSATEFPTLSSNGTY